MIVINSTINTLLYAIEPHLYQNLVKKILKKEKLNNKFLSITFIDDKYMKELNKTYRNKDKTTDILTFSFEEDDVLGDIYISLEQAKKNIGLNNLGVRKHSVHQEVTFLIVHGICHLLGYTHNKDKDQSEMEAKQQELLWYINRNRFTLIRNFRNASDGIFSAIRHEVSFRFHVVIMFLAVIIGYILKLSSIEWIAVSLTISMVLLTELINTSIEAIMDFTSESYHEEIKIIKDISAGAVFVAILNSIIVGSLVYLPKMALWFL